MSRSAPAASSPGLRRLVILVVEDDPGDLVLVRRLCEGLTPWEVELLDCEDGSSCLERLGEGGVDLVLLDYRLGSETGLTILKAIRLMECDCPVVFLTGMGSEQLAVEALQAGASDYLPKHSLSSSSLQRAVENAVGKARLQQALESHQESLQNTNALLHRRNLEITRFYRTVSHELRAPLTSARDQVSRLVEEGAGPLSAGQDRSLRGVLANCDRLVRCVDDLLDVARIESGKLVLRPTTCDLDRVVRDAVDDQRLPAERKGVALECSIAPELPNVWADEMRVAQVLENLLSNALEFTPPQGEVRVRVACEGRSGGRVQVSVEDTGRGIDPREQESIFEPLYQAHEAGERPVGLGLGLSISRQIVRQHGGRIGVESTPGRGATFRFTLPVSSSLAAN